MRVSVTGSSLACLGLRGNLTHAGYRVVDPDQQPVYRVIVEDTPGAQLVIDIPDALFGRLVTHAVAALAPGGGVFVQHVGGNLDPRTVRLLVPSSDACALAVERGVVRALDETLRSVGASLRQRALVPTEATATGDSSVLTHLVGVMDGLTETITAEAAQTRAEGHHDRAAQTAELITNLGSLMADHRVFLQRREELALQAAAEQRRVLDAVLAWQMRPRWWQWRRR